LFAITIVVVAREVLRLLKLGPLVADLWPGQNPVIDVDVDKSDGVRTCPARARK